MASFCRVCHRALLEKTLAGPIERGLARAGVKKLAAVIPVHSHYELDRFDDSMAFLRAKGAVTGVDVRLPAQWQAMDVWAGLPR